MSADKVIGSRVLNILIGFLHLEMYCLYIKGYRSHDIGDGFVGIVDTSVEHCICVGVHG